ncbi:MAG: addiction module protein [Pseudomonadota bacterium]
MNARTDHVLLEALALPAEERSLIALSLLDSLQNDGLSNEDVTASWVLEARQRNLDISSGKTQAIPLAEFKSWFDTLE